MSKTNHLSVKEAVLFRRLAGMSSLALSIGCVLAVLFGFIPIYYEPGNPLNIVQNVFEIFNVTSKPIWYCVCCAGYSIVYIVLVIKSIKNVFEIIKTQSQWFGPNDDGEEPRKYLTNCVRINNEIVIKVVWLLVLSYVIDNFQLGLWRCLIFATIVICNLFINVLRLLYMKRNVMESIFSPLSTALILVTLIMFVFRICKIELSMMTRQAINATLTIGMLSDMSIEIIIETFCANIITPIIYLFVIIGSMRSYIDSISYGRKMEDFTPYCKKTMIRNIIFALVLAACKFVSANQTQIEFFVSSVLSYSEFILLSISVYFLSKNQGTTVPDAPYSEEPTESIAEETDNNGESNEAVAEKTDSNEESIEVVSQ